MTPGTRIGPYEVISSLGAGGMGEVFLARDARLSREVAIKVIKPGRNVDADAVVRFEREARAAASLNHPHIVAVFDVGNQDGAPFIVCERLMGETIRSRIAAGPVSQKRALEWSAQAADALAAAHAKGIVHRDLKPENLFVTSDDRIKVLDFGLAKLLDNQAADTETQATESLQTASGVVLGTAGYMSPEQVSGGAVDHRTDLFSLGAVLYELLTRQPAFRRATSVETMSAAMNDDVAPPSTTNPQVSLDVDGIVLRCLEKRPERRFQSASDLAFALSTAGTPSGSQPAMASAPTRWRGRSVGAAAVVAIAAMAGFGIGTRWDRAQPAPPVTAKRFTIDMQTTPLNEALVPIALSPDGSTLVHSSGSNQASHLYVRHLGGLNSVPLAGTLQGSDPFFSPDGRWVGFRAQGELRKVPVSGGAIVTLAKIGALGTLGGSWGSDGWIYYSFGTRLWRVSENGGTPEELTTPDPAKGEVLHYWPQVLPGNQALIFSIVAGAPVEASSIAVMPVGGGSPRTLIEGASFGRYLESGHLFFTRGSTGFVARFDADRQALQGEPRAVLENVWTGSGASARFTAAGDGTIAFVEGISVGGRTLAAVDRSGKATPSGLPPMAIEGISISPDERRLALVAQKAGRRDIWISELANQSLSQVTLDGLVSGGPVVWRSDSLQMTYARRLDDRSELVTQSLEGARAAQTLLRTADQLWPGSWSPRDQQLFFMRGDPVSQGEVDVLESGASQPRKALSTKDTEWGARISPDGAWLAYVSNATGSWEVYVQPWPGPGTSRRISLDGGTEVVWRRDGRELFYRNGTKLMAVPVTLAPSFTTGTPAVVFDRPFVPGQPGLPNYDVSADGQRFYMVQFGQDERIAQPIHVIVNWFDDLRRAASDP